MHGSTYHRLKVLLYSGLLSLSGDRCLDHLDDDWVVFDQEAALIGRSTIYHRNYGDSRLAAVLEALCFYCWGLDFGPVWGAVGGSGLDISYRAVNLHGVPPVEPDLVIAAKAEMEAMLGSLR